MQRDSIKLRVVDYEPAGFAPFPQIVVAEVSSGGFRYSIGTYPEWIPDYCHRLALHQLRPAHDRQPDPSPRRPDLLRHFVDTAFPFAVVVAPGRAREIARARA